MKPRLILFLDKDNRILSPAAEVVFRSQMESAGIKATTVVSAGINNEGFVSRDGKMDSFLSKEHLSIGGIVTPLSAGLLEYADWVICMDEESRRCRQLTKLSDPQKRIFIFPETTVLAELLNDGTRDYPRILEAVSKGCEALIRELETLY